MAEGNLGGIEPRDTTKSPTQQSSCGRSIGGRGCRGGLQGKAKEERQEKLTFYKGTEHMRIGRVCYFVAAVASVTSWLLLLLGPARSPRAGLWKCWCKKTFCLGCLAPFIQNNIFKVRHSEDASVLYC